MADKWRIQPICKKCHYRVSISSQAIKPDWSNSVCNYLNETGNRRDGSPNGNHCSNFLPRGERKRTLY